MLIFNKIIPLQEYLQKNQNKTIGFVPTMGALHKGHLSLIKESKQKCEITVCSIFVNPIQFNKQEDLDNYPRHIESDIEMLESVSCEIVFIPSVEEMYPTQKTKQFDFGSLGNVMEGEHRPGHFNGVGIVIERFFNIIDPDYAFFGEKDFQQLAIIRELTKQLNCSTKIIGCPIYREETGLAMSSRNERLTKEEKEQAKVIFESLQHIKTNYSHLTIAESQQYFIDTMKKYPSFAVEYFNIADGNTLQPIVDWNDSKYCVAFAAVNVGNVRLIDNMTIF